MTEAVIGLLGDSGKQLAQRFLATLALPGVLFVAVTSVAVALGQRHSLDVDRLLSATDRVIGRFDGRPVPALLGAVAAALTACAIATVCSSLGSVVQRLWVADRPRWLIGGLADRRRRRWDTADKAFAAAEVGADRTVREQRRELADLAAARNAIALVRPARATWIGDRLGSVSARVWAEYGVDLSFGWPRLWLVLPDPVRSDIRQAARDLEASTTLAAWGILYLALGLLWWPAALAGLATIARSWTRSRTAAATLADLVEGAFDIHLSTLLSSIHGSEITATPTFADGERLNLRLRKGA
ncbi:hypothetical protein [Dactylosporangium matsuzakiense]|uniref:Vegetative cell wall protein gp1 n=1 Tax=Dactylosporangium matsuzakiense TaxID=53360 RepID=A0A9W6KPC9_9ACTN|nr:hypothetical protein [Dactylosporangium matsuzakiense]GLL05108.1 hypothetical protein GCM10017581_068550 [Dactylosporangium matsuzakiense]